MEDSLQLGRGYFFDFFTHVTPDGKVIHLDGADNYATTANVIMPDPYVAPSGAPTLLYPLRVSLIHPRDSVGQYWFLPRGYAFYSNFLMQQQNHHYIFAYKTSGNRQIIAGRMDGKTIQWFDVPLQPGSTYYFWSAQQVSEQSLIIPILDGRERSYVKINMAALEPIDDIGK